MINYSILSIMKKIWLAKHAHGKNSMVGLHRNLVISTRLNSKIWSNYLCSCLNHSSFFLSVVAFRWRPKKSVFYHSSRYFDTRYSVDIVFSNNSSSFLDILINNVESLSLDSWWSVISSPFSLSSLSISNLSSSYLEHYYR